MPTRRYFSTGSSKKQKPKPPKEIPHHLLALDPGKANGWAKFEDGEIKTFGIIRGLDKMDDFLVEYVETYGKPDYIVYENFRLFAHKAQQQQWSKMEASQVEGKIKLFARMLNVPCEGQDPSTLPIAVMWSKMPLPKNHDNSHHYSALNHGVYWLVKNKFIKPYGAK